MPKAEIKALFDHLLRTCEKGRWKLDTERFCRFGIDEKQVFGGLLNRKLVRPQVGFVPMADLPTRCEVLDFGMLVEQASGMRDDDLKTIVAEGYDRIAEDYLGRFGQSSVRDAKLAELLEKLPAGAMVLDWGVARASRLRGNAWPMASR